MATVRVAIMGFSKSYFLWHRALRLYSSNRRLGLGFRGLGFRVLSLVNSTHAIELPEL